MPVKIAPSLLAADFGRLSAEVAQVEAHIDLLHLDVMDGHFVPNLTFGMPVIASLRATTELYFDCHLMVSNPISLFIPLAEAGANLVTVHIEVHPDPGRAAAAARAAGLDFGLVVSPATPLDSVIPYVELCDLLLVMSVNPGFGGQAFIPEVLPKVEAARKFIDSEGLRADIQIDGGINPDTASLARAAGADVIVAGSAIFGDPDPAAAVGRIRAAADGAE